jgi:hypothetical protein
MINRNLPKYINFANCELMLIAASIIAKESGRNLDENIKIGMQALEHMRDKVEPVMRISSTTCSWYSQGRGMHNENDAPLISTMQELFDFLYANPIRVGDYEVEVQEDGIQVGCTFVEWNKVKEIAALAPQEKI